MLELVQTSRICQRGLKYNYLNEKGMIELEFILMYTNKKMKLTSCFQLVHIVSLLMLFLKPCEAYCIVDKIVDKSRNAFKTKSQDKLDWYLTPDMNMYTQNLCTFV